MRRRSDLDKMRRRVARPPLTPGGPPYMWVVPEGMAPFSLEALAWLRESIMAVGVAPGSDVWLEVVREETFMRHHGDSTVIRVTAVRRDTNSIRPARWSFDPERTPR